MKSANKRHNKGTNKAAFFPIQNIFKHRAKQTYDYSTKYTSKPILSNHIDQ
jgi:hypothetical protein